MHFIYFSDLDQSLLSTEKLDRASPDIWPERNCNLLFPVKRKPEFNF